MCPSVRRWFVRLSGPGTNCPSVRYLHCACQIDMILVLIWRFWAWRTRIRHCFCWQVTASLSLARVSRAQNLFLLWCEEFSFIFLFSFFISFHVFMEHTMHWYHCFLCLPSTIFNAFISLYFSFCEPDRHVMPDRRVSFVVLLFLFFVCYIARSEIAWLHKRDLV